MRLALSDLENRGLIYRKHGKGTFAHGSATRVHRYLGILMKSPQATEHRPVTDMLRGAQMVMASLRSAILLASNPPEVWQPEKASSMGGVVVVPQNVTAQDLEVLRNPQPCPTSSSPNPTCPARASPWASARPRTT